MGQIRNRCTLLPGTLNEVAHLMTLLSSHWLTDLPSPDVTFLKYPAGFKRLINCSQFSELSLLKLVDVVAKLQGRPQLESEVLHDHVAL